MASIHSWTQKGNTVCMTDHEHLGSSEGKKTKKAAIAAAVLNWREFTAWEYGDAWASWRRAKGKKITCSVSSSGHSCSAVARACKRVRRRRR